MTAIVDFSSGYAAVTEAAGLLDRSDRGKLALAGPDAKDFLQGQVTQDINGLSPGQGAYAAFLTPKGKMLGDLRVLDAGGELLLDTERVALQALFNMIRRYSLGYRVELHKRTLESALLSLIGPRADAVLAAALGTDTARRSVELPAETEHAHVEVQLGPAPVRVIRTDLGLDLLVAAQQLDAVRELVIGAGASAVNIDSAECLRIEHGRPRYGVDLDDGVIPQEAGLNDRAVSFTKGCYVGQETVARLFYKGKPNRSLRGLTSVEQLAVGTELLLDGRVVGTVTSSTISPQLGPLALALVRREAPAGAIVEGGGREARVAELPFA